jgi:hypothetical protein
MKAKKNGNHANGHNSAQALVAKAAATQKIADAARKHFKMLKAEFKQARKAFKQAKKAARRARKEAKAAAKSSTPKPTPKRLVQKGRHVQKSRQPSQSRPTVALVHAQPQGESARISADHVST